MILSTHFDKERAKEGFTYFTDPCVASSKGHYTYSEADTIAHAKLFHPSSSWAKGNQSHK